MARTAIRVGIGGKMNDSYNNSWDDKVLLWRCVVADRFGSMKETQDLPVDDLKELFDLIRKEAIMED